MCWCSTLSRPESSRPWEWRAFSGRRIQTLEVWTPPPGTSWTWCCTEWGWWQHWGRRGRMTRGCSTGWSEQSPESRARRTWKTGIFPHGRAASTGWTRTPPQLKAQRRETVSMRHACHKSCYSFKSCFASSFSGMAPDKHHVLLLTWETWCPALHINIALPPSILTPLHAGSLPDQPLSNLHPSSQSSYFITTRLCGWLDIIAQLNNWLMIILPIICITQNRNINEARCLYSITVVGQNSQGSWG